MDGAPHGDDREGTTGGELDGPGLLAIITDLLDTGVKVKVRK